VDVLEIDPAVKRIASDTSWFCYPRREPHVPRVVLGDARRSIAADTRSYDHYRARRLHVGRDSRAPD
jgi:hypothetical protein